MNKHYLETLYNYSRQYIMRYGTKQEKIKALGLKILDNKKGVNYGI